MNRNVIINFADGVITLGGVPLFFPFDKPGGAFPYDFIVWGNAQGFYQGDGGRLHEAFPAEQYDLIVRPYAALWEAEKARLEEEANRPPTQEEARAGKLAEVMDGYSAAFAPIEAVYPQKERETWPIQLEEARAYLANPGAETPVLSILVAIRGKGETVAEFAAVVMANNAMYRQFAAHVTGQQQRMYAEVNALAEAGSAEAITAYEVRYEMPPGMEEYLG